jgi:hypothetical protein
MGMPELDVPPYRPLTELRGGTLLIVNYKWRGLQTDLPCRAQSMLEIPTALGMREVLEAISEAVAWLQASPQHRVFFRDYHHLIFVLLVWVRADMHSPRRVGERHGAALPAQLVHDVMTTLHGRDRRTAAAVCSDWSAAANDAMLHVTDDDVRVWVAPRIAAMKHAYPISSFNELHVEALWALTRYWLEGGV